VGFPLAIPILWTIGIILVVIGAILALLGAVGHVPTSTDVSAGEPPLGLLKPWPALSQRRYIGNRRNSNQIMPSPGRQVSRMASRENDRGRTGQGVASHRPPRGLPHASPGAEPTSARASSVEGCPRAGVWSGCARSTGRRLSPHVQDR
jgi:hypothetical protein